MTTGPLPAEVAERFPYGYAVADVETSGLNAQRDRVLQLSIMQMDAQGGIESAWSQTLDPGCDPGPVHIHGLTRERLMGSPQFQEVAPRVSAALEGRVLVAHNASFDWQFLMAEADRAAWPLGPSGRLCTMALSRRLDINSDGLSLAKVAAYWGVTQRRAHDAGDDTRVTLEILRHSLVAAARLGLTLPVVTPDHMTRRSAYPTPAPRHPCPWQHPGRYSGDAPLVQGMTIVFTGSTDGSRDALVQLATERGLDVMNTVSRRTSLLVTNDATSGSRKTVLARAHGTPTISEREFVRLVADVAPGQPKAATRSPTAPMRPAGQTIVAPAAHGPLCGRRVLILGGPHGDAVSTREKVVELGGQVAVNLSASVTDVVTLRDATLDRRWARVCALELGRLNENLEEVVAPSTIGHSSSEPTADGGRPTTDPLTLARGEVVDLPDQESWELSVQWDDQIEHRSGVDVVAFVVDHTEHVGNDEDFCFFNNPEHPSGAVRLTLETPGEALVEIHPTALPAGQRRVVVAAALDGSATFGDLGPIELVLRTPEGIAVARSTLDAASTESTLLLATVYDREGTWRLRAVGQGFENDLAALAVRHGVDVAES